VHSYSEDDDDRQYPRTVLGEGFHHGNRFHDHIPHTVGYAVV
jgi:hypothetical protein